MKGLKPTPYSRQRYSFGAIWGYIPPDELPYEYDVGEPLEIKDQKNTQCCVAFSGTSVSEYQEGVILAPEYTIKVIAEEEGAGWVWEGTSLEAMAKASLKGFLAKKDCPFTLEKNGADYIANTANWPEMYDRKAAQHKKAQWFWIGTSAKLSMFDAIRSALYRFKDEKRAVQTGVLWRNNWGLEEVITQTDGMPVGGHALAIKGFKGDYLKIQNSYGLRAGKDGIQLIHKDVVNRFFNYGALMSKDMPEMAHEEIIEKSKLYRSWIYRLLSIFRRFGSNQTIVKSYLEILRKVVELMKKMVEVKKFGPTKLIYQYGKECLGKDVSEHLDEYACAESVNAVVEMATGLPVGGGFSTYMMFHAILGNRTRFIRRYSPMPGYIIISPSGYGNGNGHVGIVSDNGKAMSNNSRTGKWEEHLTLADWKRILGGRGFPILFFEVV